MKKLFMVYLICSALLVVRFSEDTLPFYSTIMDDEIYTLQEEV